MGNFTQENIGKLASIIFLNWFLLIIKHSQICKTSNFRHSWEIFLEKIISRGPSVQHNLFRRDLRVRPIVSSDSVFTLSLPLSLTHSHCVCNLKCCWSSNFRQISIRLSRTPQHTNADLQIVGSWSHFNKHEYHLETLFQIHRFQSPHHPQSLHYIISTLTWLKAEI